jgi:hypothetical protein
MRISLVQSGTTIYNGSGFQTNGSNGTGSQVYTTGMIYLTLGDTVYTSLATGGGSIANISYPHIATLYLMSADV